MASLSERVAAVKARGRDLTTHYRVRWLWLDHLIRSVQRYQIQFGDRLAGAVTYFAFLSLFPLLALTFSVFGYVLADNAQAMETLKAAVREQLPGLADQLNIDAMAGARVSAGIIGLIGLLYAGLGAVAELRGALREISMTTTPALNVVLGKLRDLVTLLLLGATMLVSVLVGGFATQATTVVSRFLGITEGAEAVLVLVGVVAGIAADWLIFLIILGWVARPTQPFRILAKGALLGGIGFTALKQLAALLLSHTLNNPVYGTFAVTAGLLLWINFSARLTLFVASWTATSGCPPPPSPSPPPAGGF
ncbi:YihY/virulence factor BrkB family protein [Nonomuraea sp. NPDC046570]|uniref:YihY/virulence factor BrkB family protein n=1 Tax=Nonomuraea sp. NPDC046570 TaxID=3155255 RepID=UPI0033E0ECCA